jgi:hypothetical protein
VPAPQTGPAFPKVAEKPPTMIHRLRYVSKIAYHTCMSKLTLSVDAEVIARAKRLAQERGTSVSALVERYLDRLTAAAPAGEEPPVLARLRGLLRGVDPDEHRRHLERKYG